MKKILLIILPLLLIVGCATDTHESLMKDMISTFDEIAEIMEAVTDDPSADAAISKLKKISKKMRDVKTRTEELGDLDEATQKDLAEKYESQMKKAFGRYIKAVGGMILKPYGEKVMEAVDLE